jgi:hypothetical protein
MNKSTIENNLVKWTAITQECRNSGKGVSFGSVKTILVKNSSIIGNVVLKKRF